MHIQIINGPNLNLLGTRQPELYGAVSFEAYLPQLQERFPEHRISYFQSNHEGQLIDKIQELIDGGADGLVLNPAAYGHTSIAIADALAMLSVPVIEVHISNIYERESFRHHTYTAAIAREVIAGMGMKGYEVAVEKLLQLFDVRR